MKRIVRINSVAAMGLFAAWAGWSDPLEKTYPAANWETRAPEAMKLSSAKLVELQNRVGRRGCVARNGFMVFLASLGNASTKMNRAAKLIRGALRD